MVHSLVLPLHDYYIRVVRDNTLVFYKGAFDDKVIAVVSQSIRKNITDNAAVAKKVFSVFVELSQNISFYSAERNVINNKLQGAGVGLVLVNDYADYYTIKAGNLVSNKDSMRLATKCSSINSLNRDGLRQLKRRHRNMPSQNKDSGNIGLIQVALLGNSPLRINLQTVDSNFSFFSIELDILKVTANDEDTQKID
jgi:hypothetical protein